MENLLVILAYGTIVSAIIFPLFIIWVANQPTTKKKTVISLNQICNDLDRMSGVPSNCKVISTKIEIK